MEPKPLVGTALVGVFLAFTWHLTQDVATTVIAGILCLVVMAFRFMRKTSIPIEKAMSFHSDAHWIALRDLGLRHDAGVDNYYRTVCRPHVLVRVTREQTRFGPKSILFTMWEVKPDEDLVTGCEYRLDTKFKLISMTPMAFRRDPEDPDDLLDEDPVGPWQTLQGIAFRLKHPELVTPTPEQVADLVDFFRTATPAEQIGH